MATRLVDFAGPPKSVAQLRDCLVEPWRDRPGAWGAGVWIGVVLGGVVTVLAGMEYAGVLSLGVVYEDTAWQFAAEQPARWDVLSRPLATALWRWFADVPVSVQHALSLAVHAVNAVCVGMLTRRLGASVMVGAVAGALFLLHPLNSEAVAYLSARADLFATTGVLFAVLLSLSRVPWLAVVPFSLACGFKESAVIALVLMALVRKERTFAWVTLVFTLAAGATYSALWLRLPPTYDWLTWQLIASGRLLSLFVWPQTLTVAYDFDHMAPWLTGAYVALVGCTAIAALVLAQTRPRLALGLAWCLSVLALRTVLVTPTSYLNEHQVYLGVAGLCIAAASLLERTLPCPA